MSTGGTNFFRAPQGPNILPERRVYNGYAISTEELRQVFAQADVNGNRKLDQNELLFIAENAIPPVKEFFNFLATNTSLRRAVSTFHFNGQERPAESDEISLNNLLRFALSAEQSPNDDGFITYDSVMRNNHPLTCDHLPKTLNMIWADNTPTIPTTIIDSYPQFGDGAFPSFFPSPLQPPIRPYQWYNPLSWFGQNSFTPQQSPFLANFWQPLNNMFGNVFGFLR